MIFVSKHKKTFLCIFFLTLLICSIFSFITPSTQAFDPDTDIFFEYGAESGVLQPPWDGVDADGSTYGLCTISSTHFRSGTKSMYLYQKPPEKSEEERRVHVREYGTSHQQSEFYVSWWAYFDNQWLNDDPDGWGTTLGGWQLWWGPPNNRHECWEGGRWHIGATSRTISFRWKWNNYPDDHEQSGSASKPITDYLNQWVHFQVYVKMSISNGIVRAWFNNELVFERTGVATDPRAYSYWDDWDCDWLRNECPDFGPDLYQHNDSFESWIWIDDVVGSSTKVSESYGVVYPVRADFTLEDITTWQWGDNTYLYSVACGDVDGDGSVEIITGGFYIDGTRERAQLAVWDGATLALEDVKTWYWVDDTYISSVAVGDVDGSGSVEIVTGGYYDDGTRMMAQLAVWDGATLALEGVRTWYWVGDTEICSVACGDVDGDGSVEIVTGGFYIDGTRERAQLCVWSGSLDLEHVVTWYWTDTTLISSVDVGDVDGDGQNEIVTGGWYYDGKRKVPQLVVWNGATLSLEGVRSWHWVLYSTIESLAVEDVEGDGSVEIVTGGLHHDNQRENAQLTVWDGTTLTLEVVKTWYWTNHTAINSVCIGDVDGDGSLEIVTGGYFHDNTRHNAQLTAWGTS